MPITDKRKKRGKNHHSWKGGLPKCLGCSKKLSRYDAKNCHSCAKIGNKYGLGMKPNSGSFKKGQNKGENHPKWTGGKYSQSYRDRRRFRDTIQKRVLERDNYTCQICSQYGGDLQVDHIQSWAEYIELRFNMDNCRTLCVECHYFITYNKPKPKGIRAWGHNFLKGDI